MTDEKVGRVHLRGTRDRRARACARAVMKAALASCIIERFIRIRR